MSENEKNAAVFEAAAEGNMEKLTELINAKKSLAGNSNDEGLTPLHIACDNGHIDIVRFLLANGANIEAKPKDGRTPLMHAISNDHFEIAEFLISKGANVNAASATNYTVLMQASAKGNLDIINEILLKIDNINAKNNDGRTALMNAVKFGYKEVIELLLANNANTTITDSEGKTVESYAESEEIRRLLKRKNMTDKEKQEEKEKLKEEEKKENQSSGKPNVIPIIIFVVIILATFGFSAYYYKTQIQVDTTPPSPETIGAAEKLSAAYCQRVAACEDLTNPNFMPNCLEIAKNMFANAIKNNGKPCNMVAADKCGNCLSSYACDKLKKFKVEDMADNCTPCGKICI